MSTLSPERWAQVEQLFDELLACPPASRPGILDDVSAGDPELGALLSRMLAASEAAPARIADAIGGAAADLNQPTDWIGRRFGPYEAVREIGHGGMGIVFEAVRADDEYRKRVALKIAPGWRAYPGLVDRFRAERQILAELETETIARFLDGGTEGGVPYFVMEFVDGEPISDFCSRRELSLRQRLRLFQQVCAGVTFAHERLVVHRDLKPANILVTHEGVPKLVDFGVAKLLDEAGDASATATSFPAWTPNYVSPEQVRGRPVSPRTDVYSLGLVLYELVCGEGGQEGDTSSLLALDRSVCEHEPLPPSERAARRGSRALARELSGDLDTIVLKAIRKDPDERYSSVAAFADDLQRYLDDRPIQARNVGSTERAVKFVRRHRTAASFLAVLVGTAAAGVISTFRQAKRAERRFQQVRSLANTFVFDVHDSIVDLPGSTEARKRIVSTALTYLESLRDDAADDPELARELAAAYQKVGSVQGLPVSTNLGDTAGALDSYANAVRILQPLVARGDQKAEFHLAKVLHLDALVRRARGDRQDALAAFDRAWRAAQQLLQRRDDEPAVLELAGSVASDHARASFELRDFAVAERHAGEARDLATRLLTFDPDRIEYIDGLTTAYSGLGMVAIGAGKIEEAAAHFRESARLRTLLVARQPDRLEPRRALAVSYGHLADVLAFRVGENLGDADGAIAVLTEAAELGEWARRHDAKDRRALYDLANVRVRLGALFTEYNPPRVAEALQELRQADAYVEELLAQDPGVGTYQYLQIAVLRRLGDALALNGELEEAIRCLGRAVAAGGALLDGPIGPGARAVRAQARSRLGRLLVRRGLKTEALTHLRAMSAEIRAQQVGAPLLDAAIHETLADGFLEAAGQSESDARETLTAEALVHLDAAAALWRDTTLAAALEPTRASALETLAAKRP